MAYCIPDTPFAQSPDSHVRLFANLRRLPDGFHVFQCVPSAGQEVDFWLHDDERRVILLKVMETTPIELTEALLGGHKVGTAEYEALCAQVQGLSTALLFPYLRLKELAHLPRPTAALFVAREQLAPATLSTWLAEQMSPPLTEAQLAHLRQTVAPEVVIPASFTVRPILRHTEAQFTQQLLDYSQEQVVKSDLELTDVGQGAANNFHLRVVTGVAGSGKSLIILYRARLLRQFYPHKRILILTHNRALIRDLEMRFKKLDPTADHAVHWFTFSKWCRWLLRKEGQDVLPSVVSYPERQRLIQLAWRTHLTQTAVSPTLLEEEINWYKDRLLFGLEDYLAADRSGRGFALLPAMRERVYQAMLLYHQRLREENRMDWEDVPRYLWREMQANPAHRVALYDFILIDEAQFFAPLWYEIIKQRLHPTGHLFLVADPSQGFLKRGQSWLSTSGLEVRGRVQQLRQSYRTTHQILDFATWFYQTRLPDDLEIVPPDLTNMPVGAVPLWLVSTSKQDETTRLINEIRALLQAGHDLGQILIIHPHVQEVKGITKRLKHAFGEEQVVDPRHEAGHGRLRICPLNGVTGLESPIVFLLGINELYEREGAVDLTEAERQELVRDNTRRLYMAMTRAGQRLVLSYVGELPPSLRQL